MTWTIAKKEILQNLTSFKFMVITLLIMVTVLVSIFIMYNDYKLRVENYEILRPSSGEPIAIVPPTPLSIFIKGLDGTLGRSYKIEFGGQIQVGLFFISSLLYLTFFFSLGLLISCLTYTSASSIVFSLFLWALIVFVVPNLGNTLARQFVKIPSVQQLEMKCEHIWIKAVFERITAGGTGNRLETWNNLRKRLRLGLTYWEILLAFNILFFAGAFVKFIRYDVR